MSKNTSFGIFKFQIKRKLFLNPYDANIVFFQTTVST